ncbi:MAG: metallophosphoesterase [Clostridia bacterium]|nr:metallophosphoesterase [Clostridia bacterium]
MNRLLRGVLTAALAMPLMLCAPNISASEKRLSTDKTIYAEGEDILVTAWGEGKDWVGIYAKGEVPGNPASIYWYYAAEDAEPGEAVSINKTRSNNRAEYASLPGGRYTVFLLLNDGYEIADSVDIVVLPAEKDRIRTAAMTFYEGDAPRVTAFGAGGEQVCLCRKDEDPKTASPLASYLLTEENSGKETALKPDSGALTPGEYTVWLFPAEGPLSPDGPIASASFTVAASEKPDAPKDLNYRADGLSDGIASGTVTLTLAETGGRAEDVLLFWGKDGKPLEGYARLAKVHAAEGPMEIVLPENLFLPEGADEILARAENRFGASPFVSAPLPEEAKPFETGEVLLRFQVTSDWHITDNPNHDHNRHLGMMLDDIASVCPDSAAVIAVGDIADHGGEKEYEQVSKIVEKHGAPPVHYVIGNHDVSMGKGYKKQIEIFNSFAGNDSAYYDLWIGGYHFIFLAFESEARPFPSRKRSWTGSRKSSARTRPRRSRSSSSATNPSSPPWREAPRRKAGGGSPTATGSRRSSRNIPRRCSSTGTATGNSLRRTRCSRGTAAGGSQPSTPRRWGISGPGTTWSRANTSTARKGCSPRSRKTR